MTRTKFFTLLTAATALAACSPAREATMPMAADPLRFVDAYMLAWNEHDAEQAAASFADSVTYYDASVGTPQVGKDNAQKNVIEVFLKAVPDCKWTRDGDAVVSKMGDAVAFQWTFSGTNIGPWGDGTKATGKKFELHGLTLIRLKDNMIVYQGDYYDALGFYKQLGLM